MDKRIVTKHILISALAQTLMERIDEVEGLDFMWKQKMQNQNRRYIDTISEHLSKSLSQDSDGGALLQKEILLCTTDILKALNDYEDELLKTLNSGQ